MEAPNEQATIEPCPVETVRRSSFSWDRRTAGTQQTQELRRMVSRHSVDWNRRDVRLRNLGLGYVEKVRFGGLGDYRCDCFGQRVLPGRIRSFLTPRSL